MQQSIDEIIGGKVLVKFYDDKFFGVFWIFPHSQPSKYFGGLK